MPLLLDGGLASQLVSQGCKEIDGDPLWSARLLATNHQAIKDAHRAFLESGADIITTNTYQVSEVGFREFLNLTPEETTQLVKDAVTKLARPLADEYTQSTNQKRYVAGSVGPYGASQHNGSEYTGNYCDTMTAQDLIDWHRPRIQALVEARVDFLAVETIPAQLECEAVATLLDQEFPNVPAWICISCKDELHTNHGELLSNVVTSLVRFKSLKYVGVNCSSPDYIPSLLQSIEQYKGNLQLVVYANSGESWVSGQGWTGENEMTNSLQSYMQTCVNMGVTIIGGCCRVNADVVTKMRKLIPKLNDT